MESSVPVPLLPPAEARWIRTLFRGVVYGSAVSVPDHAMRALPVRRRHPRGAPRGGPRDRLPRRRDGDPRRGLADRRCPWQRSDYDRADRPLARRCEKLGGPRAGATAGALAGSRSDHRPRHQSAHPRQDRTRPSALLRSPPLARCHRELRQLPRSRPGLRRPHEDRPRHPRSARRPQFPRLLQPHPFRSAVLGRPGCHPRRAGSRSNRQPDRNGPRS